LDHFFSTTRHQYNNIIATTVSRVMYLPPPRSSTTIISTLLPSPTQLRRSPHLTTHTPHSCRVLEGHIDHSSGYCGFREGRVRHHF
jgi:hypothetical protein